MTEDADEIVTFRLGPRDRAAIQRLVERGEFRNRSDFLRYAVKSSLQQYDERPTRAQVDLELEGVSLPEPPAGRTARHAGRARKGVNL